MQIAQNATISMAIKAETLRHLPAKQFMISRQNRFLTDKILYLNDCSK